MSAFSHVQIAYFRRLYDTYRSKSAGINHNDLVLILRHLGPDVAVAVAKQKIRDHSKSGDFIKFDDFCRLLAGYQAEIAATQVEFMNALRYFVKKKAKSMPYGITEGSGLNRSDLVAILLSGTSPLSITEANAAVNDVFRSRVAITVKQIVRKVADLGSLWASVSFDHKYISSPPCIVLKIHLTDISDLSMFDRVKHRQGQGIAYSAFDPFIRVRFGKSALTTTIRNAKSGIFWPRLLTLPIRIASVSLDDIQSKIGFRNSLVFDLMDSQRVSRSSIYAEWIGTGRLRLTTVMRQSIGVVPYEVSLDCQNGDLNVKLRLTIEMIGPSLGAIFDSVDASILANHRAKLARDMHSAAGAKAVFTAGKKDVPLPGVAAGTPAVMTKAGIAVEPLLDRVTRIYHGLLERHPRRNMRLFGRDYNDQFALIVQFVTDCQIVPVYQIAERLAESLRFLNSNPAHSCESENTDVAGDVILPPDFFIRRGFASMLDRSLFLCGLFRACALDAFVVTGNDGLYDCVWVIDVDANGAVRHWDTLTGAYSYKNSYVPGAVWNHKQLYVNVCAHDRPDTDWNMTDTAFWQPLLLDCDQLKPRYRYRFVANPLGVPSEITSTKLLVAAIQSYRQARLGLTTAFYGPLCSALHILLQTRDVSAVLTNRSLQDYARPLLYPGTLTNFRQILFRSCPINIVVQELIWMGLLDCTTANAVFGIAIDTRSHGLGLTTTTVIIGYVVDLNSVLLNSAE